MQSVYDSIKAATAGLDLSKPLKEQIQDMEQSAIQSTDQIASKLKNLEAIYENITEATKTIDLSKPLVEQMRGKTAALGKIENKIFKIQKEIERLGESSDSGDLKKFTRLQTELRELQKESKRTENAGIFLRRTFQQIGYENIEFASNAGLKKLQADIKDTRKELNDAEIANANLQRLNTDQS